MPQPAPGPTRPSPRAAPPAAAACQLLILRNSSLAWQVLHVEEVELLDADGSALPRSSVTITMSSHEDGRPPSNCNDGVLEGGAFCSSKGFDQDPSPWLAASYPCSVALSAVVVHNRQDQQLSLVRSYSLQHWVQGRLALQQPFLGSKRRYTFELGG